MPKFGFTTVRNVGWHASDAARSLPTGIVERETEPLALYHVRVSERLGGNADGKLATKVEPAPKR